MRKTQRLERDTQIVRSYIAGQTAKEIGDLWHLTPPAVVHILAKHGVERRRPGRRKGYREGAPMGGF